MKVVTDGIRSRGKIGFARNRLAVLDKGDTKHLVVSGYKFSLNKTEDSIFISAPPGTVACSQLPSGEYRYHYADQYGGDFATVLERPPAEGFVPRALLSHVGELMAHGYSGYSVPVGMYGTLIATYPAPNTKLPENVSTDPGYLDGGWVVAETSPETRATYGLMMSSQDVLYGYTTVGPLSGFFLTSLIRATKANTTVSYGFKYQEEMSGVTGGISAYMRPVWGESGAIVFVPYRGNGAAPGGSCGVLVHYLDVTSDVTSGAMYTLPSISAATIGIAAGGDGVSIFYSLMGTHWPVGELPMRRGQFSCNQFDVCYWGPIGPSESIKGLVFTTEGTANLVDVILPTYNQTTEKPVITEVSPGNYVCEVIDVTAVAPYFQWKTNAVYYGSPFSGWLPFTHLGGTTLVRHKTVSYDGDEVRALVLLYDGGADETVLYEYDSLRDEPWQRRGRVCEGLPGTADVAIFGTSDIAVAMSKSSPVRWTWF